PSSRAHRDLHSFPTRRSSDLDRIAPPASLSNERVTAFSAVRRLVVERTDPVLGRCRYVADLGEQQVTQPILVARRGERFDAFVEDRKSTRLNSSHLVLSYAVF